MVGEAPCKICGTPIPHGQAKCPLCGTEFSHGEGGKVKAKVTSEKKAAEKLDIDISDPEVRKTLEDLTLIPGISRRGALVLYKQGIRSASDFIKKAMPGEAFSERYAQVIANRLAIDSAKTTSEVKERQVPCPSCRSPNKATSKKCGVCGAQLSAVKKNIDLEQIQGRVNETIKEVLGEFAEGEDFSSLPGDMKAEIAAVLSSEREITEDEAKEVAKTLTSLPDDMTQMVDDMALGDDEPEAGEEGSEDEAPSKKAAKGGDEKQLKKRQILVARLDKWRKMGYDVSELEPLVDGDFETFKARAKEVLASKLNKGKKPAPSDDAPAPKKGAAAKDEAPEAVKPAPEKAEEKRRAASPEEREKFSKQIGVWKSRGYDVKGLKELLETDMEEFKKRSMAMLKAQMKK
jgi:hypothetical protein